MDVKVTQNKKSNRLKWASLSIILFSLILWLVLQPSGASKVNKNDIWTGTVQRGDLQLHVSAYGRLKSKTSRLLTAKSNATVDEIILKPGALVESGSVILKLTDPLISQALSEAKRSVNQSQNQFTQLEINQKRELLAQKAQLETLRSSLESAALEVNAQQQLIDKGIVSNIDYQRSLLEHRQLTRRLKIEQQRIEQLRALHIANLQIAQSNIDAQKEIQNVAQSQFHALTVTAGITGVVQSLSVEIGQSVSFGQQLALVGSTDQLYALLSVPQSTMQQVKLSQNVAIDTRGGIINGVVSRIDPVINNGSVEVEVVLNSALTHNARPELNIQGKIDTGLRKNVLYINKPIGVEQDQSAHLFRLNQSIDEAKQIKLQFGAQTHDKIEIISGAKAAEQFILSDMSRWQAHSTLTLM